MIGINWTECWVADSWTGWLQTSPVYATYGRRKKMIKDLTSKTLRGLFYEE